MKYGVDFRYRDTGLDMVHKKVAFSVVLLLLNWFTLEILTDCNFHSTLFNALKSFASRHP